MRIKNFILMAAVATVAITPSCKDAVVDPVVDPVVVVPVTSATDLTSKLVTVPPVLDGTIDASWDACDKLAGTCAIPDTNFFAPLYRFFADEKNDFVIRSMHDADNIYFLVEIADLTKSVDQKSWYYDATAKGWVKPGSVVSKADKFGEDKFGFIFPVNDNANWNKKTCFATCHTDNKAVKNHYTDSVTFMADVWHWRSVNSQPSGQLQDGYITIGNTPTAANNNLVTKAGRASDATTAYTDPANSASKIWTTNVDTLNNGTKKVAVPKYVLVKTTGVPVIRQVDIDNGDAQQVTAVDASGILTLKNGSKIDPIANATYGYKTGTTRIPSVINRGKILGSQGDVSTYANYVTGKGWVIEVQRTLKTADTVYDTQFDITKTYMFGFAIFDNGNAEHEIKTNLKLKF